MLSCRLPSGGGRPPSVREQISQWRAENVEGCRIPGSAGKGLLIGATGTGTDIGLISAKTGGVVLGGEVGRDEVRKLMTPRLTTPRQDLPQNMTFHQNVREMTVGYNTARNISLTPRNLSTPNARASPRLQTARPMSARPANRSDIILRATSENNAISQRADRRPMARGAEERASRKDERLDRMKAAMSKRAEVCSLRTHSKRTGVPVRYERKLGQEAQEEIKDLKAEVADLRAELQAFVNTQSPVNLVDDSAKDSQTCLGRRKAGMYYAGRVFPRDIVD